MSSQNAPEGQILVLSLPMQAHQSSTGGPATSCFREPKQDLQPFYKRFPKELFFTVSKARAERQLVSLCPQALLSSSALALRAQQPCFEDPLHQSRYLSTPGSWHPFLRTRMRVPSPGHQPRLRATQGDATQTERAALLMPAQSKPTSQVNDDFSHRAGDVCINTIKEWGFWSSRP